MQPKAVVPDINQIRVRIKIPFRERLLPLPPHPIRLPDNCLVPRDVDVETFCYLQRGSDWRLKKPPTTFTVTDRQHEFVFEFERPPGPVPSTPPGQNVFNLKLVGPDGNPVYALGGGVDRYSPIAEKNGLRLPIDEPTSEGIRMHLHDVPIPIVPAQS